jgi:uncharacterized zinc-type alcohol dehydrogenase-like protein
VIHTIGWAAPNATNPLAPFQFERREPGPRDVLIDIEFCGVCHSDIHQARDQWHGTIFPVVPGHEIIGRVRTVGEDVTKFTPGDLVGVGCMVDSCRTCEACAAGLEQYCRNGPVFTYNSKDPQTGDVTYGGYSNNIVVTEDFVLRVPENLDPAAAAPLLCAGITTYSPLRHWQAGPGRRVGVVGMGGLGHMAVKFAAAMGAQVVVLTRSPDKVGDALNLGASSVLLTTNAEAMSPHARSCDLVLSTIGQTHDVNPYLELLERDGAYVVLGAIEPLQDPVNGAYLVQRRISVTGSLIGGIAETQEMLDFCGKHNITSDIEKIAIQDINKAFERTVAADVKYRFVIDMASLNA